MNSRWNRSREQEKDTAQGTTNGMPRKHNSRWNTGNASGSRGRGNCDQGSNMQWNSRDQSSAVLAGRRHNGNTNSRWQLSDGPKMTKNATKEELKESWAQIKAARLAKSQAGQRQQYTNGIAESDLSKLMNRSSSKPKPDAVLQTPSNAKMPAEPEAEQTALYEPPETLSLRKFFSNSEIFAAWEKTRSDGWTNANVANFFNKKKTSHDNERGRGKKGHGTDMWKIGQLFNRFYRYAYDIDNGTNYVARAARIAEETGSCDFLDFGFAPGGMSHLLLHAHKNIRGAGVTLDPSAGGNVWPTWMNDDPRFFPYVGDVVDMARAQVDLPNLLRLPEDFEGFDFVIVGITIHQGHLLGIGNEGILGHANELKDRLHFAQLYFAFKYLKPGGMVLMRHHMSVRLVDFHFLALMLSLFDPRLAITNSKEQKRHNNPENTSLPSDTHAEVLEPTILATKPMAEFAIRKTFWVVYQGFDREGCDKRDVLGILQELLHAEPLKGPYTLNEDIEEKPYFNPILCGRDRDLESLLEKYGNQAIQVLENVWQMQVVALQGFMDGKKDRFCRYGNTCRQWQRGKCHMAHYPDEMVPQCWAALQALPKHDISV